MSSQLNRTRGDKVGVGSCRNMAGKQVGPSTRWGWEFGRGWPMCVCIYCACSYNRSFLPVLFPRPYPRLLKDEMYS